MPLPRRRIYTAAIVVVLVAVNIVAIRWSAGFFRANQSGVLLRYGDRIPRLKGQALAERKPVELLPNRNNLILYFSSTRTPTLSIELMKYAEIVSQQYRKDGLNVTAILSEETPELKGLIEHSLVNYDLIVDGNRQIAEKLGLGAAENGVFIFDDHGVCRFSTRRPMNAADLRQLIAVEFLRVDPFAPQAGKQQEVRKGKPLGSWSLVDVRSWERTSLDQIRPGTPKVMVFFSAECSVCSLPGYLEEFAKFEHRVKPDDNSGRLSVLVFDFNFSMTDVLEQLKSHNISSPAYIANEELPKVEDMSQDKALYDETVVAVQTDAQEKVVDISPLKSLIDDGSAVPATKPQSLALDATRPTYEETFRNIPLSAYDVAVYQGKYILTDFTGNRVFIVKDNMEVERQFGRIGSGPGQLVHPGHLDVAPDGTIYIEDGGNERIAKFDQLGNYLGELRVSNYEGLAAGARNELYLGQPQEGYLITAYSSSGKKLRSFGQLKKYSEIYGAASADKDVPFKTAFNRVRLSTDQEGNLYVSFLLTPLLQKYSPDGNLLFERKLEAPEIDRLIEAVQKQKYITMTADGADARIVALDPVIEPATGNILVPLVDGSIYLADRAGNKLALLHPQDTRRTNQTFYPFIAGLGAKQELLVTPFPPKHWYRLTMPAERVKPTAAVAAR